MSVQQRMARAAEEAETNGMAPLLKEKLHEQRTVFSPGHRIRMNVVPMFLNIFIPWGLFIFVCGTCSFYVMYMRWTLGWFMVGLCILFWVITVIVAINRRKYDPEPGWYIFFSAMVGIAVFAGIYLGNYIYDNYSFPYYQVKDLKVLYNLDPSREHGQNVLDAGMFYFNNGARIDAMQAWHFKQKTVYCVAPIINPNTARVPMTQSYDFWAVGKDCCSTAASDFRCGDWNNPLAKGGIRNMQDKERAYYRLAVEQAASLYGINAISPVFFEWSADPVSVTDSWNQHGFTKYLSYVAFMLIFFSFAMAMATAKFSFMGRDPSVYGEQMLNDEDWQKGGYQDKPLDLHTHEHRV